MKVLLVALVAAASVGTAVMAQVSAPAPTAVPAPAPVPIAAPDASKDPNARVCKTEAVIGRRVPSRICMTRAEWNQRTRDAKESLDASQRGGLATCATTPCGG